MDQSHASSAPLRDGTAMHTTRFGTLERDRGDWCKMPATASLLITWLAQFPVRIPFTFSLVSLGLGGALLAAPPQAGSSGGHGASTEPNPNAFFGKYCTGCHNAKLVTGGLALDKLDASDVAASPAVWEKVAAKIRTGEMPPKGLPRPSEAVLNSVAASLEKSLDDAAAARVNPGRVPIHRLNRAEYANAIRDLLGVDIDGRSMLVADDADQQGFENIAGILSVSPALLESYMRAAAKVARLAVGDAHMRPVFEVYDVSKTLAQDDRMSEDLPFGSRGGIAIQHQFPLDATYVVKVRLRRQLYDHILGLGHAQTLEVRLDGGRIKSFVVGGEKHGTPAPATFAGEIMGSAEWEEYTHSADANLEVRIPVKAGTHQVSASFVAENWAPEGITHRLNSPQGLATNELAMGNAGVDSVSIGGPYDATGLGESASRKKIFVCEPASASEEDACASRILTRLASRAYRRPATTADTRTLIEFFKTGRATGGFDAGIELALERILVDPDFLFRIENAPAGVKPGQMYRLNDLDLASRLSFFLWSSIPDDELLKLAESGKLSEPQTLDREVRRMVADPRAGALVKNFVSQWLDLGRIRTATPDPEIFPAFDDTLRQAFEKETELFFESQIRQDRAVPEMLDSNYTFLNEALANHYGIPSIYGSHFRRVSFEQSPRGGMLGQGSLLMLTSYANRTSPVLRGKWLLDNILGMPPPPPPPGVPPLKASGSDGTATSVRARMEEHRKNSACAGCHSRMDPLGFSLENFDAVGRWRQYDENGIAINASATLPDGTAFDGIQGLRTLMNARRDQFVRTFIEKLLTYALGREVEYYDLPAVRRIARESSPDGYRWSSIILGIARSTPFYMSTVKAEEPRIGASLK